MDQAERERRADQRARGRRQNCCAEAIPRRRGDREDPEAQQERHDVQRGERVKALRALEYAHRNRGYERCDEACLGQDDHTSRVDVEQIRERQGQHERKHDQWPGRDESEAERPPCERIGARGVARRDASRHLTRDRHLQRLSGDEDDRQQPEERRERAVSVAAEQPAGGEQEDVVRDDRNAGGNSEQRAASRPALALSGFTPRKPGSRAGLKHRLILREALAAGAQEPSELPP